MMKWAIIAILIFTNQINYAQEYVEEEWIPPLPPIINKVCSSVEQISEPVVSYQISKICGITDITLVGDYKYGAEQIKSEVKQLSSDDVIRRFVRGNFVYFREVRAQLNKAFEREATLVCTLDMMGKKVIDAKIIRKKAIDNGVPTAIEEPVIIENNQLTDLGIFTYTRKINYVTNTCPDETVPVEIKK